MFTECINEKREDRRIRNNEFIVLICFHGKEPYTSSPPKKRTHTI